MRGFASPQEAAEICGISVGTFTKYADQLKLPYSKLGDGEKVRGRVTRAYLTSDVKKRKDDILALRDRAIQSRATKATVRASERAAEQAAAGRLGYTAAGKLFGLSDNGFRSIATRLGIPCVNDEGKMLFQRADLETFRPQIEEAKARGRGRPPAGARPANADVIMRITAQLPRVSRMDLETLATLVDSLVRPAVSAS